MFSHTRPADQVREIKLRLLIASGLGLFFLLSYCLYGGAALPPDFIGHRFQVAGAFGIFLAFAAGIFMIGLAVGLRLFGSAGLAITLGVPLGLALAVQGLLMAGLLGALGASLKWLWLVILIGSAFALPAGFSLRLQIKSPWPRGIFYRGLWCLIALELLLLLALSFRLYPFWDPLWYHLVAPRVWYESGKIQFTPHNLIAYMAGSWDLLYLFAPILVGAPAGGGLLVCQLFGQWTHLLLGAASSVPVILQVNRLFSRNRFVRALGVLSAIGTPMFFFTILLAKNDWGVLIWAYSGIFLAYYSIRVEKASNREIAAAGFFSGLFLGLAFSTKWSLLFLLLPMGIHWIWEAWRGEKARARVARFSRFSVMGFLLGIIPLCSLKFAGTGDPFFPAFSEFFGSKALGPTWFKHLATLEGGDFSFSLAFLSRIIENLREFSEQNFFYYFFFLCPFMYWSQRRRRNFFPIWLAIFFMLLLFFLRAGSNTLPRWIAPGVIFMGTICIAASYEFLLGLNPKTPSPLTWKKILQFIFLTALFMESPILFLLESFSRQLPHVGLMQQVLDQPEGEALFWARGNLKKNDRLLFLAETRVYYVSDLPYTRLWDDAELDVAVSRNLSPEEDIKYFFSLGYRFMIDTNELIDEFQNESTLRGIHQLYQAHPDSVVFTNPQSRVIDLEKLAQVIEIKK